jgi:hypothetical protein
MFIGAMALAAAGATGYAASASHTPHLYFAIAALALAAATSRMKVKLPGINGNMSVNLPFLLTAIVNLSAAEAVTITAVSTVVQCWPRRDAKFKPEQMLFNLSMMTLAGSLASVMFHAAWGGTTRGLVIATATLFLGQTAPVAAIVGLSEDRPVGPTWFSIAQLSFPYYVVGAGVTSLLQSVSSHMGWGVALAAFPVMYMIHRSYRLYFGHLAETSTPKPAMARAARAGA